MQLLTTRDVSSCSETSLHDLIHSWFLRWFFWSFHFETSALYRNALFIDKTTLTLIVFILQFLSVYKVQHLRVPTLFISGLADTLVPPRMMAELHNRCGSERKQVLQVPAGTHNETWTLHGYYHSLAVFLQNCRIRSLERTNSAPSVSVPMTGWSNVHNIWSHASWSMYFKKKFCKCFFVANVFNRLLEKSFRKETFFKVFFCKSRFFKSIFIGKLITNSFACSLSNV